MRILLLCALLGCASAQYVKTGVKGGYGQGGYGYRGGENLVKFFGNSTHSANHTQYGYNANTGSMEHEMGVCYIEVPTASLVHNPAHVPTGNGSRPELSRIRTCCKGYIKNIYNYRICDPVCTEECINALCSAPNICTCFPDHVKNRAGICVPTCPIGCQNGQCAGGECICNDGYELDSESRYCSPKCIENCGGLGNCTAPNVCHCRQGYQPMPEGSCKLDCGPCTNGDCVTPNECRCRPGYEKKQDQCVPQCSRACGPDGQCVSPDVCKYPGNLQGEVVQAHLNGSSSTNYPHLQGQPIGSNNPYYHNQGDRHNPYPSRDSNGQIPYQGQNSNYPPSPRPNYSNSNPGYTNYPTVQAPINNSPNQSVLNVNSSHVPNYPYPSNQNSYHSTYGPNHSSQESNNLNINQGYNPNYPNGQRPINGSSNQGNNNPNSGHGFYYPYPSNQNSDKSNYGPNYPTQDPNNSNINQGYNPNYPIGQRPINDSSNQGNNNPNSGHGSNYPYPSNQNSGNSNYGPNYPTQDPNNPNINQGYNPNYPIGQRPINGSSNQGNNNPNSGHSYYPYPSNHNSENSPNGSNYPGQHPNSPNQGGNNPNSGRVSYNPYPTDQNSYHPPNEPNYYPYYPNQPSNPSSGSLVSNQGSYSLYPNLNQPTNNEELGCSQPCINGVCVQGNRCSCNPGYVFDTTDPTGTRCIPSCPAGCPNGICSAPNFCVCNVGYRKDTSVKGRAMCIKRLRR